MLYDKNKTKFHLGDKVKVIKYGHPYWHHKSNMKTLSFPIIEETENLIIYDISSDIVGQVGTVRDINSRYDGKNTYALDGIPDKTAWYYEEQLELIPQ